MANANSKFTISRIVNANTSYQFTDKINVITECQDFFGSSDVLCLVPCQLQGETHSLVNYVTVIACDPADYN